MEFIIPFPPFSIQYLPIWFAQMESAFVINGIVEENDKYDCLITQVPAEFLAIVEEIVLDPPSEDKYESIKYEFIKRMTIQKLKEVEFGIENPSEYLQKLKQVAKQRVPHETILNIWLNNLPEKVREVVSLDTSGNVDKLCEIANKTMALLVPTPPAHLIEELLAKQIESLMRQVESKLLK